MQKLDCSTCKQSQTMARTSVRRMSTPVVAIGYILLIPSILGVLFWAFALISAGAGGAAAAMVAGGMVCSFVSGLLGYLLVMKKKVYRCESCGFVLDRA